MTALLQKIRAIFAFGSSLFADRTQHQPVNFTNIKALLLHLCDFDQELSLWVMRWLAYPLRNPGARMDRALVVNGEEGTGKNLFFNGIAARLYEVGQRRSINDQKLFAIVNEWAASQFVVVTGQFSKANAAKVKEMVAAEAILVQRKGEQPRRKKNYMNLVFLSSSTEFLPVIETDPRLCLIEAPPPREKAFYDAVVYEIMNGGLEVFRNFLIRDLDMGDFDQHTKPPMHAAGRAVLEAA